MIIGLDIDNVKISMDMIEAFFFSLYTLACIIYNGKSTIAIKDYYVRIVSFPSPRLPADIYSSMYYLCINIIGVYARKKMMDGISPTEL